VVRVNRSRKANHYGTVCERRAAKQYGLDLDRASWHDARFQNGTPVEIKSAMYRRADGSPGRFRVFRKYHDRLRAAGGWYAFVVYQPRGSGLQVRQMKMTQADRLPLSAWYGAGGHRDSEQTKLAIEDVF
jgi:hypothetical protein